MLNTMPDANHAEMDAILVPLLQRSNRGNRERILGMTISAVLETYQAEDRYDALAQTICTLRALLPRLA